MMPIHVGRYLRRRGSRKAILATHTVSEYSFPEEHVLTAHVWRSGTEAVGSLFPTDILIGDDRYVFLGVESRYGFSENDVFVFDAIRLMRRGAKFRFIDIIKTQAYKDFNSAQSWNTSTERACDQRGAPRARTWLPSNGNSSRRTRD